MNFIRLLTTLIVLPMLHEIASSWGIGYREKINNLLKRMDMSIWGMVAHCIIVSETHSQPLLSLFFEQERHCLWTFQVTVKPFTFRSSSKFFTFSYFFHRLLVHWTICIYFWLLGHICVFFHSYVYHVYKRLNVLVSTNAFIFFTSVVFTVSISWIY